MPVKTKVIPRVIFVLQTTSIYKGQNGQNDQIYSETRQFTNIKSFITALAQGYANAGELHNTEDQEWYAEADVLISSILDSGKFDYDKFYEWFEVRKHGINGFNRWAHLYQNVQQPEVNPVQWRAQATAELKEIMRFALEYV